MKKKYLLLLLLIFIFSCDNLKSRKNQNFSEYDPSQDQDTCTDYSDPGCTAVTDLSDPSAAALDMFRFIAKGASGNIPNSDPPLSLGGEAHWDPVYYLQIEVYIEEGIDDISDNEVQIMFASDDIRSVNSILYQAGIIIESIKFIERVRLPYSVKNEFIFSASPEDEPVSKLDGTPLSDTGTDFRVLVSNNEGGDGIASVSPRSHAFRVSRGIGRNVMAHEIGHIFRLWHTNIDIDSPCIQSASNNQLMLNTIFDKSLRLADCEILIMRAYAASLVSDGYSWINTSSTASNPPDKDILAKHFRVLKWNDTRPNQKWRGRHLWMISSNRVLRDLDEPEGAADSMSGSSSIIGPPVTGGNSGEEAEEERRPEYEECGTK